MHPEMIAALANERPRQYPCGAAAERPWTLCRKCQARMAWRRKNDGTSRRAARRPVRRQARDGARLLAGTLALLRVAGKGVES
jgi:hypothetical protein